MIDKLTTLLSIIAHSPFLMFVFGIIFGACALVWVLDGKQAEK